MLGNREIEQVSPPISEHANTWDAKQILQILFFNNPNKFFCDSFKFVYLNVYSIALIPVGGDLRLSTGSFSRTRAGNRASSENRSKESSKEV